MGDISRLFSSPRMEIDPSDAIRRGFTSEEELFSGEINPELEGDWGEETEGSLSGYSADYDPSTGETTYFKDVDLAKAATAIGKIEDYEPPRPVAGSRPPSLPSMGRGRVSGMTGERPYPYAAPSYLASSVDYNKLVGQLVNTLLKGNIRPRKINPLL
jgi:hypothetical protein